MMCQKCLWFGHNSKIFGNPESCLNCGAKHVDNHQKPCNKPTKCVKCFTDYNHRPNTCLWWVIQSSWTVMRTRKTHTAKWHYRFLSFHRWLISRSPVAFLLDVGVLCPYKSKRCEASKHCDVANRKAQPTCSAEDVTRPLLTWCPTSTSSPPLISPDFITRFLFRQKMLNFICKWMLLACFFLF